MKMTNCYNDSINVTFALDDYNIIKVTLADDDAFSKVTSTHDDQINVTSSWWWQSIPMI